MKLSVLQAGSLSAALLTLPLLPGNLPAQLAISANDHKAVLVNGVNTVPPNPAQDTITVIDLGVSPPKVLVELPVPSSVVGPPQNVAISPDESLALVSANMKLDPSDPRKLVPDNRVTVIALGSSPPAVVGTVQAGLGPAGISINRAGTLALVANRNEGTVSVLTIAGSTVTAIGKVDFGNATSGPSSVAFSPDGKMALVSRDGDHRIAILSVDGTKVEDTKRLMTGGFRPYAIQVSPKGDIAVVGNQGGNAGDIDTINVIDVQAKAPRIVRTIDVAQIVEGLAFSPDGSHVAVTAQHGSARVPDHPFYNDHSVVVVFAVKGTELTRVAEAKIGKWSQGVVWSRDGKTLLAQNMAEHSIAVLSFDGQTLQVSGEIKVNGGPAGLRTAER